MTPSHVLRHARAARVGALALAIALGCAAMAPASAENLVDTYRQALQADPVLKQAEAQSRIGNAQAAATRAVLLPQLNGSVSYNDSHGTNTGSQLVQTPTGPAFVDTFGHNEGRSRTESVGLNQVLFDLGRFADWQASKAIAHATQAQYAAAQQDLIIRVAQAYFTILSDEDQLQFAKANRKALQKQRDQAQAKFDVGFAPITDVADAKAQYDAAVAEVVADENVVFKDRQALAQITGQKPGALEVLRSQLPLHPPTPNDMETWVKTALANNPSLQAQRDQVESARHDVTAAHAARLPTLGASVNYARNPAWGPGNASGVNLPDNLQHVLHANSRTTGTTVGLVLTVPLFAGGGIHAQVQQALAQRDQANDVLEQDRRAVVSNTRNAFNAIETGVSSVDAQKQAVLSAKTALDATRAGYEVGTNTIVDLLLAQQTFFQAQSAYSQARHALVINRLNLEFAAGTLSFKDLESVNALLQ